jgi:hypothetical protein
VVNIMDLVERVLWIVVLLLFSGHIIDVMQTFYYCNTYGWHLEKNPNITDNPSLFLFKSKTILSIIFFTIIASAVSYFPFKKKGVVQLAMLFVLSVPTVYIWAVITTNMCNIIIMLIRELILLSVQ